jgi:hypothetical protein
MGGTLLAKPTIEPCCFAQRAQPQKVYELGSARKIFGANSSDMFHQADPDRPRGLIRRWEVSLRKDGSDVIGADIDHAEETKLEVLAVCDDGVLKRFNIANPCNAVSPGDWIVAVNGIANDSAAMVRLFQECSSLRITVERACGLSDSGEDLDKYGPLHGSAFVPLARAATPRQRKSSVTFDTSPQVLLEADGGSEVDEWRPAADSPGREDNHHI